MCTAATYQTKDFYFGRNLDYESTYGESVTIMPRHFVLHLRNGRTIKEHYAVIGMAHVRNGYPLYYDGMNEKGLCIAGLNFVGNASYEKEIRKPGSVAQFELIPWLLSVCASVEEARKALEGTTVTGEEFEPGMPAAQLHWMIADRTSCIVLEIMEDGMHIYDNPAGVLTNNPTFPMQLFHLNNYAGLSAKPVQNRFGIPLASYSRGMGAIGLPGDLSSQSRFVRASFVRANSRTGSTEKESAGQLFHILASVEQQKGCCELENGKYEYTIYSSCMNADQGIYYYKTYDEQNIRKVQMKPENRDGSELLIHDTLY